MKAFYIEIDKFKEKHNRDFLIPYANVELKTEKRFWEYTIGRYLVKQAAKNFYNVFDTEIITNKEGKPVFKNADLHFSIAHSKNIVIACFDTYPCGIDIEYIKKRDLKKLSKYFEANFNTLEEFYKFWTLKEALYKLQQSNKCADYCRIKENYALTTVGQTNIDSITFIAHSFS